MMSEINGVACIVPFYNERAHIRNVMNVLRKVRGISQLIAVDDGSTDKSFELLRNEYPEVELLRQPSNCGKAEAVKHGLDIVKYKYVLLVDADLRGLKASDIQTAVDAVHRKNEIDMIILRRLKSPWHIRFYRIDTLLSGERIVRTSELKEIFKKNVKGYQLETAINVHMQENNKRVYWAPSSAMNTFKMDKYKPVQGLFRDFVMYLNLISAAGLFNVIKLVGKFGKERLPYVPRLSARKRSAQAELAEE